MRRRREEQSLRCKDCVESLVLPAQGMAIQLEAHAVELGRGVDGKSATEPHADFFLSDNVHAAFEPFPGINSSAEGLDVNAVT